MLRITLLHLWDSRYMIKTLTFLFNVTIELLDEIFRPHFRWPLGAA